jgi:hypothetical protein
MTELGNSLERMSFAQLLLLFAFVASYVLALGGLLGPRSRRRAALLALACAAGFTAATDPWVHGALLMVFVIAALGLFVVASWLLARLLGSRGEAAGDAAAEVQAEVQQVQAEPAAESQPMRHPEPDAPELAQRARAVR